MYNIYFHPLSRYPGPKLYAATSIPFSIAQLRGQWHSFVLSTHEKYGPVVRVAPNQLYFITSKAWGDIYARRGGAGPLPKDPNFWKTTVDPQSMVMANDTEHARIRRIMSPGFSQRSILQQEYLIQANVDILLSQLQKRVKQGIRSDLREWYSHVTFDILGDLAFGELFHCLQTTQSHGWVQMILDFFYGSVLAHVVYRFRPLDRLLALLLPISIPDEKENRNRMALETIKRRVQSTIERPDFISYMLEGVKAEQMSLKELEEQSSVILMAGSDTSSITLTYATFYIAANPQVLDNLRIELMRTFKDEQEISILGINQLQYLHAVVQEVLRMSTPVPNGFQRQVPKGGVVIDGKFVPEKVRPKDQVTSMLTHYLRLWSASAIMPHICLNRILSVQRSFDPSGGLETSILMATGGIFSNLFRWAQGTVLVKSLIR